jgi:hypothetical protein
MAYPKGVWKIEFNSWVDLGTHHSDDPDTRIRIGAVRVRYMNGTWQDFDGITREDYYKWYHSAWKPRCKPAGVTVRVRSEDES